MHRVLNARGVRLAMLGVATCAITFVGLQALVPRSAALQSLLALLHRGPSPLATAQNAMCESPAKNLQDEVFFVSCGGFF
ncbi:MAG: hypothetical protein WC050_04005 [Candidatus Paceibacterota bacterium]